MSDKHNLTQLKKIILVGSTFFRSAYLNLYLHGTTGIVTMESTKLIRIRDIVRIAQ